MIKYGYFVVPGKDNTKGYITVSVDRPAKEETEQINKVAFAFCSPKDEKKFSKKLGRVISDGRRQVNPIIINYKTCNFSEIVNKALSTISETENAPSWALRSIKKNTIQYGLHPK